MHLVDATMFFAHCSGGVKRYLMAKREWLSGRAGLQHTLLIPDARSRPAASGVATIAALPLPFSGGYRFPLRTGPWYRQLVELQPDLIEAGDPYVPAWGAARAAQTLGVPALAFHHSDIERLAQLHFGSWSVPVVQRYLRSLYGEFDAVAAPSRYVQERLEAFGIRRTVLQPLGVDTRLFHPSRRDEALRSELGAGPQTRLLVYAGRLVREKNVQMLVKVARRLGPGYRLLLIGGSRRRQLEANVSLLPYQERPEFLARYLASADLFVHAGVTETFGLVLAEAMACGRPVVAVAAGSVPELVDESVGQLAAAPTVSALIEAVESVFERGIEQLGRNARHRAESRYDWNVTFDRLLALYQDLTGISGTPSALRAQDALS